MELTNHGISRAQEELVTCRSGKPIQDGGRSSDIRLNTSVMFSNLIDAWTLPAPRMKKEPE
jgi:hypothetical protein